MIDLLIQKEFLFRIYDLINQGCEMGAMDVISNKIKELDKEIAREEQDMFAQNGPIPNKVWCSDCDE